MLWYAVLEGACWRGRGDAMQCLDVALVGTVGMQCTLVGMRCTLMMYTDAITIRFLGASTVWHHRYRDGGVGMSYAVDAVVRRGWWVAWGCPMLWYAVLEGAWGCDAMQCLDVALVGTVGCTLMG